MIRAAFTSTSESGFHDREQSQSQKVRMACWFCFCCSRTSQLSPGESYLKARWWQKVHETMVLVATFLPADPVIVWTVKLSVTCFGVELETWKWELYCYPTHYTLGFNGIRRLLFPLILFFFCNCVPAKDNQFQTASLQCLNHINTSFFLPHSFPGKCINIELMSEKASFLLSSCGPRKCHRIFRFIPMATGNSITKNTFSFSLWGNLLYI